MSWFFVTWRVYEYTMGLYKNIFIILTCCTIVMEKKWFILVQNVARSLWENFRQHFAMDSFYKQIIWKFVTQHKNSRSKMFIDDIFQNSPLNWAKNCRKPSDVFLTFLFHSPNLYNFWLIARTILVHTSLKSS